MPPDNSRTSSPPADSAQRAGTPPSYLSALRVLESPVHSDVLNLAATLTTQAEDADVTEDLDHIRSSLTPQEEWRIENVRERLRRAEERVEDRERRERLRRIMSRLSHMNESSPYSDRIPSHNNLYDWSPASEADDEEELDQILAELRREQPTTHPEILRVLGRSQLDAERETRMRAHPSRLLSSNQPSQSADSSLRSAAILQSVRRHPRFSARIREHARQALENSTNNNNRSSHPSGTQDRNSPPVGLSPSERSSAEISRRQAALQRYLERQSQSARTRNEPYRLDRPNTYIPSSNSVTLENSIKYLSHIRNSNSEAESWIHALDAGILTKEYVYDKNGDRNPDFVIETASLPPPVEVSWLVPGAVLSGCQHAHTATTTITPVHQPGTTNTVYRFRNQSGQSVTFDPARPWQTAGQISPRDLRALAATNGLEEIQTHSSQQDHWPVKVTIHSVDFEKMCLSATMEAYNVPSHPHPHQNTHTSSPDNPFTPPVTRTASITTYLEGEILDFNKFTLVTESFKSDPGNDAMYWRKLPPFQKYSDEELVRKLVSRKWLTEELGEEYILMRWKERCFVKSLNGRTPDPIRSSHHYHSDSHSHGDDGGLVTSGSREEQEEAESFRRNYGGDGSEGESNGGLTISGFYYICLRRADGGVEGLYFDPQSSPYQHLRLESISGGRFPAWGFR